MTIKIKSNDWGTTLLKIQLSGAKIKTYPSFSNNVIAVASKDYFRTRKQISKIISPRKVSYEITEIEDL